MYRCCPCVYIQFSMKKADTNNYQPPLGEMEDAVVVPPNTSCIPAMQFEPIVLLLFMKFPCLWLSQKRCILLSWVMLRFLLFDFSSVLSDRPIVSNKTMTLYYVKKCYFLIGSWLVSSGRTSRHDSIHYWRCCRYAKSDFKLRFTRVFHVKNNMEYSLYILLSIYKVKIRWQSFFLVTSK